MGKEVMPTEGQKKQIFAAIRAGDGELLKELLSQITFLDIGDSRIGVEEAKTIAEALKTNATIRYLNICRNRIGIVGARVFAEALKTNITLECFNISVNEIGDEGAKAFAEALKINTTLYSLSIDWNGIGHEGAREITEALKTNKTLTYLHIWFNRIGVEGEKAILSLIEINRKQWLQNTIHYLNKVKFEASTDIRLISRYRDAIKAHIQDVFKDRKDTELRHLEQCIRNLDNLYLHDTEKFFLNVQWLEYVFNRFETGKELLKSVIKPKIDIPIPLEIAQALYCLHSKAIATREEITSYATPMNKEITIAVAEKLAKKIRVEGQDIQRISELQSAHRATEESRRKVSSELTI